MSRSVRTTVKIDKATTVAIPGFSPPDASVEWLLLGAFAHGFVARHKGTGIVVRHTGGEGAMSALRRLLDDNRPAVAFDGYPA